MYLGQFCCSITHRCLDSGVKEELVLLRVLQEQQEQSNSAQAGLKGGLDLDEVSAWQLLSASNKPSSAAAPSGLTDELMAAGQVAGKSRTKARCLFAAADDDANIISQHKIMKLCVASPVLCRVLIVAGVVFRLLVTLSDGHSEPSN
jgi:hypothetical protein